MEFAIQIAPPISMTLGGVTVADTSTVTNHPYSWFVPMNLPAGLTLAGIVYADILWSEATRASLGKSAPVID